MSKSRLIAPLTVFATGLSIAACIIAVNTNIKRADKETLLKDNMEYIKQNAPDRYVEILENASNINNKNKVYDLWAKNAESIRDSLRIDSIAKANYTKGLLMAKDSLSTIK